MPVQVATPMSTPQGAVDLWTIPNPLNTSDYLMENIDQSEFIVGLTIGRALRSTLLAPSWTRTNLKG